MDGSRGLSLGILLASLLSFASADYHIGFIVQSIEFLTPRNILANGSCCDSSCGANGIECCDNGCSPSMRICFRESQHLADDPSCPLLEVLRNTAQSLVVLSTNIPPIQRYYTGGFQAYLRLSHFDEVTANANSPDFDPPFSDPLIDEVFFEFNLSTTAFSNRLSSVPQLLVGSGESGRVVVSMLARTHCAQGWTGQHCSIFCNSSTGIEICSRVYDGPFEETATTYQSPTVEMAATTSSATTNTVPTTAASNLALIGVPVSVAAAFSLSILFVISVLVWKLRRRKPDIIFVDESPNLHHSSVEYDFYMVSMAVTSYMAHEHAVKDSEPHSYSYSHS